MDCIQKEVRIHALIDSPYAIKLYQTIKTTSNIYMLMDYCNGFDLSMLLRTRKRLTQEEARQIIRKMVHGIKDIWKLNIIHRDMKLANILLHFPDYPELGNMTKLEKRKWLATLDLRNTRFEAKISDFGLSTILESANQQLSICGTPLYSSP